MKRTLSMKYFESGLPNYHLHLKIGVIVMLVRNISVQDGLSNGTKLIVKEKFADKKL